MAIEKCIYKLCVLYLFLLEFMFACFLLIERSHKVKLFSQRFFQMLSFPLSLASVVIIELVTFVTGIVKVRYWSVYISGCL